MDINHYICRIKQVVVNKIENNDKKDLAIESEQIKKSEKYKQLIEQIRKSVNSNAWDGRWFKRAFMDDGKELGSLQNDECKIDSIAQSWSVISNMGDNDKKYISMESLENHLVDTENGIIKFLKAEYTVQIKDGLNEKEEHWVIYFMEEDGVYSAYAVLANENFDFVKSYSESIVKSYQNKQ